ncbi:uncharacterized protein TM35_000282250 [Trypanosoma theileri]|uniref:Uncharacterized protein n=1 Tax=Trypanosoma theileri TaxID=67003 RepID=A0A1X0NQQ0_9TRYP|nr:uncharacterized protein TM35_000282250 [Trypanosoma theileri]ORC86509.1 hypothetical protein TM35_000282250 [Trypanosoma theileri]
MHSHECCPLAPFIRRKRVRRPVAPHFRGSHGQAMLSCGRPLATSREQSAASERARFAEALFIPRRSRNAHQHTISSFILLNPPLFESPCGKSRPRKMVTIATPRGIYRFRHWGKTERQQKFMIHHLRDSYRLLYHDREARSTVEIEYKNQKIHAPYKLKV